MTIMLSDLLLILKRHAEHGDCPVRIYDSNNGQYRNITIVGVDANDDTDQPQMLIAFGNSPFPWELEQAGR